MKGNINEYEKIKVYFFGTEEQKRLLLKECIAPYIRSVNQGNYYLNRDFNGGPNIEIITKKDQLNVQKLQSIVYEYCIKKEYQWTQNEIEENLKKYIANLEVLTRMEKKNMEPIDPQKHLYVERCDLDLDYYKKNYNSSQHVLLHFQCKFILEPLLEEMLDRNMSYDKMLLFVIRIYQMVANLFEYGEKYASMMYYSNIAGVFAIAKQYQKEEQIRNNYKSMYKRLEVDKLEEIFQGDPLLEAFSKAWDQIFELCNEAYENNEFSEEGYYRLEDQTMQMVSNASSIDSEFHDFFLQTEGVETLITGQIHMVFRSIVNILYSVVPFLGLNFLEKNFCCYAVTEYIFHKYQTDWMSIMRERSENNDRKEQKELSGVL